MGRTDLPTHTSARPLTHIIALQLLSPHRHCTCRRAFAVVPALRLSLVIFILGLITLSLFKFILTLHIALSVWVLIFFRTFLLIVVSSV